MDTEKNNEIPTKTVWIRRERIAEYNPHLPKQLSSPWAFTGNK